MRGPHLFPALQGQTVTALRVCDPSAPPAARPTQFGAIALQCERHALLCYCPMRYLPYPHGSTFGCFCGAMAFLPFRANLCEVEELEDWLPISAGAHWSHHVDPALLLQGEVLTNAPQLVKAEEASDWQLAFRFLSGRQFQLSRNAKCNRLQLASAEVDLAA
ncbi:hypothetical protein E4O93_19380 [Diaphorobacter sp. DS2]|nr:hypothetical protein E4O93_19380 [Diaphorobacter sp. DS2]